MPFILDKDTGLPLKTFPNADGTTTTLAVDGELDLDPFFQDVLRLPVSYAAASTNPGNPVTVLSYTVSSQSDYITGITVSCRTEGLAELQINGTTVQTMRTGAAMPTVNVILYPASEIAPASANVDLIFTARLNSTITSVECKLSGFQRT